VVVFVCRFCNVCVCLCVGFYCVVLCMCAFCNLWVCVCGFCNMWLCVFLWILVMCGPVYVLVFNVWVCV